MTDQRHLQAVPAVDLTEAGLAAQLPPRCPWQPSVADRIMITQGMQAWVKDPDVTFDTSLARMAFVKVCLERCRLGDWGALEGDDRRANETAGERIMGAYPIPPWIRPANYSRRRLWIITEADRTTTTVLWPDEY